MKEFYRGAVAPGPNLANGSGLPVERVLGRPELARVVFQPIANLTLGTVAGYEALVRFPACPAGSPERWLAAANRAGLGPQLEALVVRTVLAARARLPASCFLAVNVSPGAFVSREVRAALHAAGSLEGLVIEITEHASECLDRLLPVVGEARAAGAMLAIDDAGAGYTSLAQIVALRPDFVKVDHALIARLDCDEARSAAVELLGALASQIDAWLVAEGVERLGELRALMRMRVPLGQGYALGYPQAEMNGLAPGATHYIRERAAECSREESVADLIETVPTVRLDSAPEAADRLLRDDRGIGWVSVVDGRGRPVALARAGERMPSPARRRSMRVTPSSSVHAVARRALSRADHERFDPVVCCDEWGRFLGLVRFERIVRMLADGRPPEPAEAGPGGDATAGG